MKRSPFLRNQRSGLQNSVDKWGGVTQDSNLEKGQLNPSQRRFCDPMKRYSL